MILFIIWLIGFFVSLYVSFKYADVKETYKHIISSNDKHIHIISDLLFLSVIVLVYAMLSWIGAVATYIIFNYKYDI